MKILSLDTNDLLWKKRYDILVTLLIFLIYLVIYLPMCARHGVAVEETQFNHNHLKVMLCNGRWGIYLFRSITDSGEYLPYGSGLIAGVFISIAIYIHTKLLNFNKLTQIFIYSIIYLGCTQWAYQLRYSNQSHAIGLGILCISIAVYLHFTSKNKIRNFAISSILICYGIATYQSLIIYYLTLLLVTYLCKRTENSYSINIKSICYIFSVLLIAVVLYFSIERMLLFFFEPPAKMLQNVQEYQKGMSSFNDFSNATLIEKLRIIGHYGIKTPIKDIIGNSHKGQWVFSTIALPAVLLIIHFLKTRKKNNYVSIILLIIIIIAPFCGDLLLMREMPMRAQMAEPISVAALWAIAIPYMYFNKKIIQIGVYAFCAYIFVFSCCRVSTIARDEHWAWQRSKEELLDMYHKAQQIAKQEGLQDCPIYILGNTEKSTDHLFEINEIGFCLNSAYPNLIKGKEWTNYYLHFLRLPRLKRGDETDIEKHREIYEHMPAWPASGSIKASKNEIIIRI